MEAEIKISKRLYIQDLENILITNGWKKGFSNGFFFKNRSYITASYKNTKDIDRIVFINPLEEKDKLDLINLFSEYI